MGRKKKGGGGMKGFLKGTRNHQNDATSSEASNEEEAQDTGDTSMPEPIESSTDFGSETKAQLRERHKKELNVAKKEASKLGKKKKQEAIQLVENVKRQHEAELQGLKERLHVSSDSEEAEIEQASHEASNEPRAAEKKSKAQKRREKEAMRLQEREARIREDLEQMGISERENEESVLKERLESMGFEMYDIRSDGHCLYKSIEDQLTHSEDPEPLSWEELRKLAAAELRTHIERYLPFFETETDSAEEAFLQHCAKVESTAEWGGEIEIQALSNRLKRKIVVYSLELGEKMTGKDFEKEPLRLCFMRHAFQLGAHYNSVRKRLT